MEQLDRAGRNEFLYAVFDKEFDKVKKFIEEGVDVNFKDANGFTALHAAIQNNDYEMAKLLIDHGADVNAQDKYGNIPLMRNIGPRADRQLIELLLGAGSDIDLENNHGISARKLSKTVVNFDHKDLFE